MTTVDLSKFKRIIDKVREVGFDEFFQAGSISQFHELNLICRSNILNKQYWVCKSFSKFEIIYRNDLDDSKQKQYKIPCKNQTEVIKELGKIAEEINAVKQTN